MRIDFPHKHRVTAKPLVLALAAALGIGASLPAQAESEIEALKRELAEQRALIQRLLAQQESQDKAVTRIEQKVASAPAAAPASSMPGLPKGLSIYGILDGGVERITNIQDGAKTGSLTRVPGITGTIASRLGFRFSKAITPDVNAIATLETGFNLDSGTLGQGGRLFGRQLFAGLETPYGTFSIGRQYSMLIYAMDADLLGPNIYAMGSLDAYLPNARYDNSLAWRGKFGKVSLGATYSLARDTSGGAPASGTCAGESAAADSNSCRGWSAMLKYTDERFGISAAIDEQRGGKGATAYFFNGAAPIAFANSSDSDRRIHLGAHMKIGSGGKVGIGWLGRDLDTAGTDVSSDAYFVEGAWNFGAKWMLDGGYHRITNDDQDRDAELYVLRGFYFVDKDFSPYAQIARINNSAKAQYAASVGAGIAPPAGGSQTAAMVGIRYRF